MVSYFHPTCPHSIELIDLGLGVALDDDDQDPDVLADPLYSINLLVRGAGRCLFVEVPMLAVDLRQWADFASTPATRTT